MCLKSAASSDLDACLDIVIATYCGANYIEEQLTSIQNNKGYKQHINKIIIVDDGSTDKTVSLVKQAMAHDKNIVLYQNNGPAKGASKNFEWGITLSTGRYIMLCDQDDVWFENKISLSLNALISLDEKQPLLAFSDVHIVDEALNLLCASYFDSKNIPRYWHHRFSNLAQQNVVSGCTMIMNRALINKALPIAENAYMHDWWLALVAKQFGELVFINKPTLAYRQHSNNIIGAKHRSFFNSLINVKKYFVEFKQSLLKIINQAQGFIQQYPEIDYLTPENKTLIALANIPKSSRLQRLTYFFNGQLSRSHLLGKLALLFVLLTLKQTK